LTPDSAFATTTSSALNADALGGNIMSAPAVRNSPNRYQFPIVWTPTIAGKFLIFLIILVSLTLFLIAGNVNYTPPGLFFFDSERLTALSGLT
jgi:hypothetical protein